MDIEGEWGSYNQVGILKFRQKCFTTTSRVGD